MRPVTSNVNFLFCEAVSIDSAGISMDAYSVTGDLTIDPEARVIVNSRTALYSDIYDFNFFTLYVLPGTIIKLRHCVKDLVVFYVFSGLEHFEEWKSDQYCESCYDTKIYLMERNSCNNDFDYQEFNLNATTGGEMFFVYANIDFHATWVNLKINLNRTVYDLSHSNPVCTDELGCEVSLDGPGITVVYHVDDGYDIGEANHPKFTTTCVPRVWAYFMIHGLAILLVGITCSMLIQKMCKDDRDTYTAYRFTGYDVTERAPLLYDYNALPPSYSSVTLSPPKYEDIIRDCGSPPPYLAAVAALNEGQYASGLETVHERGESVNGSLDTSIIEAIHNDASTHVRRVSVSFSIGSINDEQSSHTSDNVTGSETHLVLRPETLSNVNDVSGDDTEVVPNDVDVRTNDNDDNATRINSLNEQIE